MNFLAHIFLSGEEEKIRIGNFIADAVKGNCWQNYDPKIQQGIHLHRAIDSFTDTHPIFLQSKARVQPSQGKYASVVIDIFYDHFLAKNWHEYHSEELFVFTQKFYQQVQKYYDILPSRVQKTLPFMVKQNWLYHYQDIRGIERVFEGMRRRVAFSTNFSEAVTNLLQNYTCYEQEFSEFFTEMISFVAKWQAEWQTQNLYL